MWFRFTLIVAVVLSISESSLGQRTSRPQAERATASKKISTNEIGKTAVLLDETLSPLRMKPSLYAPVIHRIGRGRRVQIQGVEEADGVKFYKVAVPPSNFGFVQADAVFGDFRPDDDKRLARLVTASTGFDQIELAMEFLKLYPDSPMRPPILLLAGDLLEEAAATLTKNANSRLRRGEMTASAAPVHSYYLNFVGLDRYRKIGVTFIFNVATRSYHYNGATWKEVNSKFPASDEAREAQKRLDLLTAKLARGS